MTNPAFSVIIPTYNHAIFLGNAIQSVLNQTIQDFEIIVVDDASVDSTVDVMTNYDDPRIRYLFHHQNKGLSATRNTGIRAAKGDYFAFLDADDYFHPKKLEMHYEVLKNNPQIGVTYNARFDLNHSSTTIRGIWRSPNTVSLSDFVLGFPFAPSDMVMRREWPFKVGLLKDTYVFSGEDFYFYCQLALHGCKFLRVNQALNYRRYHAGRIYKNIPQRISIHLEILDAVFNHPLCPSEVANQRESSIANIYKPWCFIALSQGETDLGQSYIRESVRLRPSLLLGEKCQLIHEMIWFCIADESADHEKTIKKIMDQLPDELSWLSNQYNWAVTQGYLLKGIRAILWDRSDFEQMQIKQAKARKAIIDDPFLDSLVYQILSYEHEFGYKAAKNVIRKLSTAIEQLGSKANVSRFQQKYFKGRIFAEYENKDYKGVILYILREILKYPNNLVDRGVLKLFLNSFILVTKKKDLLIGSLEK